VIFRKLRTVFAVILCLFAAVSAVASDSSAPRLIPRTSISIEELMFAPGQTAVQAVRPPGYKLCVDGSMQPEFWPRFIIFWTKSVSYELIPPGPPCKFSVFSGAKYVKQPGDIKTTDCIARIKVDGSAVTSIMMFTRGVSTRHYYQCEFRMAMAAVGYQGALHIDEKRLFLPTRFYGYNVNSNLSPLSPEAFIQLQISCPGYRPQPGQNRAQAMAIFNTIPANWSGPCKKTPSAKTS